MRRGSGIMPKHSEWGRPMMMTGLSADFDSPEQCSWIYVLDWVHYYRDWPDVTVPSLYKHKYWPLWGSWQLARTSGNYPNSVQFYRSEISQLSIYDCRFGWNQIIKLSTQYIKFTHTVGEQAHIKKAICSNVRLPKCYRCNWLHSYCFKGSITKWVHQQGTSAYNNNSSDI